MKVKISLLAMAWMALTACQQAGAQDSRGYVPPRMYPDASAMVAMTPGHGGPGMMQPGCAYPQGPGGEMAGPPMFAQGGGMPCEGGACGVSDCGDCAGPVAVPPWSVSAEFLFLRPRDVAITYAVPIDTTLPQNFQMGHDAVLDFDYQEAYRFTVARAVDSTSSVAGTWTHYKNDTTAAVNVADPLALRSLVSHPAVPTVLSDGLSSSAFYKMEFDLADVDYRWMFLADGRYSLTLLAGGRYAKFEQGFDSIFGPENGRQAIFSDVNFEGAGIRVGLEAERRGWWTGALVYGRGTASFLAGNVQGTLSQTFANDPSPFNEIGWKAGRVVSMLDLEVGVGWASPQDHFRFTAGYQFSGWFNMVKMGDFIPAAQGNNFLDLGDRISFDGLVARTEIRW